MSRRLSAIVGCECSGVVREELRALGVDAVSCDIQPADDGSAHHIKGDIRDVLRARRFDFGIFHPPCTRLTNTGVSWLNKRNLWADLDEAAALFRELMNADIYAVAVENPIPHRYAVERIGRKYDQLIQPWMFGHLETKATCLWLKNLPLLIPTTKLKAETMALPSRDRQRLHYLPPSADRAKLRSVTYTGIAKAMAAQWVPYLISQQDALRNAESGRDAEKLT